jgi:hypothetical protein
MVYIYYDIYILVCTNANTMDYTELSGRHIVAQHLLASWACSYIYIYIYIYILVYTNANTMVYIELSGRHIVVQNLLASWACSLLGPLNIDNASVFSASA